MPKYWPGVEPGEPGSWETLPEEIDWEGSSYALDERNAHSVPLHRDSPRPSPSVQAPKRERR